MAKLKLEVGQTVVVKCNGRYTKDFDVKETTVSKIGRKYFCLEHFPHQRFNIETGYHDASGYTPRYKVYTSNQEISDEKEVSELNSFVSSQFNYGNSKLSLTQLRKIKEIIEDNNEN